MDSIGGQGDPWTWAAYAYRFLAPTVHVRGRMALLVLAVVLWAFLWLLWRAYTVISTDNDVLVEKLGLDIPPEPILTLEEIAARQIQISWKPEETTSSIHEYHIELNGRTIGATKKHETAAVIANLSPTTLYEVRVFSISPGRFQTPSRTLHIRTCKAVSVSSQDGNNEGNPTIRVLPSRLPSAPVVAPAPPSTREPNAPQITGRRGTTARKTSPAGQVDLLPEPKDVEDDQGEDLAELSQQFSEINAEIDGIEAQTQEEEREFEAAKKEKEEQRQTYLQEVKERDEASNDLKKQVHRAEAAARSLLNEKTKKEKQLKDKENRKQKKINEMAQWEESAKNIAEEIEGTNKIKEAHRRRMESEVREVKEKIAEEQREIQQLEEENKEKAAQLKELQEERKRNSADEETDESREADRRDQERDVLFRHTLASLSQQYNQVWSELQKMQQEHVLARQRLAMFDTARRATAVTFAPMVPLDIDGTRRVDRFGRRGRHTSSHGSNVSSPRVAYAPEPYASVNEAVTTSSPLGHRNPLFNNVNGMTMAVDVPQGMDEDDDDPLLAIPMSPRADALLPTDLLGDDSADEMLPDEDDDVMPTMPTTMTDQAEPFPTFRPGSMHGVERDPAIPSPSPGSNSSPRSFASPREEFFSEGADQDRRSIRSSHPPIPEEAGVPAEPPHKRLTSMSNLFSFSRQRGKTSSTDQPPALGSLKHESHSFPRKVEEFDSSMQPRRRLSYGGNWAFPGGNFLAKDADEVEPKPSFTRRAFPNLLPGIGKHSATRSYDPFAPARTNSLDPNGRGGSSSPRPGSTYSFDVLPRPSVEQVSWEYRPGARNSPLVPDWASSISRSHSRRPSVGFGSQTNLSLKPDEDGDFIEPRRDNRPLQAPIGTRPASSQRPLTPKLNPNAPTFTMFSFGKNRDKVKEKDRSKLKEDGSQAASPPESRKSKDAHSIALTTSTMESRESLERTPSGFSNLSPSLESTPASKPTFISKITRKASSNKFDSWKTKSTSIFSSSRNKVPGEATTPTGDANDDEPTTSGSTEHLHLGRSLESTSSTPGATPNPADDKKGSRTSLGSWNFMRKKPKASAAINGNKEDLTASEISENGEREDAVSTTDYEGSLVSQNMSFSRDGEAGVGSSSGRPMT
ncbi:hypothetical protein LTS08_002861 [Lithohypha guttulata]|nr:hypothetical protein LTS08_002861 [Lithohypha guttulata]